MRRRSRAARALLHSWLISDRGGGAESCVLIAGCARSGTTWLGSVVAQATNGRYLFEPFVQDKPFHFVLARRYGQEKKPPLTQHSPYAPAKSTPGRWHQEIDQILRGSVGHNWCDRFTDTGVYHRRVVKGVRINLMLGYLAEHWPELKVVFVVRNPVSVVNSQLAKMNQGWAMEWQPSFVLNQHQLMADWLEPFRQQIESADGVVERQTLKWCIENFVALKSLQGRDNVLILQYEDLICGAANWASLGRFLRPRGWSDVGLERSLRVISPTADRSADQIRQSDQPHGELSQKDERTIADVVETFGLEDFLTFGSVISAA